MPLLMVIIIVSACYIPALLLLFPAALVIYAGIVAGRFVRQRFPYL